MLHPCGRLTTHTGGDTARHPTTRSGSYGHWKSGASSQIRSQRVGMARMGDSGSLVGHHGCPSITQTGPTSWVGFSGKGVFKL